MRTPKHLLAALVLSGGLLVARGAVAQQHGEPEGHGVDVHTATPAGSAKGHDKEHPDHGAEGNHGAAPHGAGGHHDGPKPLNIGDLSDKERPALIALLVNFGLLAALYYTLGKKPIAEGLKQRRVNIGKAIEEARERLKEAKERAKKYQGNLKNVDADAETAKTGLIAAGKGEVEKLLTETEERAERMKRDADRLVDQERKQLQQDLLIETIDGAVVEAEKLLIKTATAEDHARLAQELLAELAKKPAAPRVAAPAARGTT